jgi:hypothetical protein
LCDAINDPWKRVKAENNEFGVRSCNIKPIKNCIEMGTNLDVE